MILTVTERPHSEISPSSFARVRACTGSVHLARGLRRRGAGRVAGRAANEGTAAHAVLEHCLRFPDVTLAAIEAVRVGGERIPVSDRMREAVEFALSWTRTHLADRPILIEPALALPWGWIGGYADVATAAPPWIVVDFKYGFEVVDAATPQLGLYALALILERDPGALEGPGEAWAVILQPRALAEQARWHRWSYEALRELREELIEALDTIRREQWTFAAGSWCRWCSAAGICPHLAATAADAAAVEIGVPAELIAAGEFGAARLDEALLLTPALEHRIRQVWAIAHEYLSAGGKLEQHKLVAKAKGGLTVAPRSDPRPEINLSDSLKRALEASVAAGYAAAAKSKT